MKCLLTVAEHRLDRVLLSSDPHAPDALVKRFFAMLRSPIISIDLEGKIVTARSTYCLSVSPITRNQLG